MARVRPMLAREQGEIEAVQVDESTVYVETDTKRHLYTFDAVFGVTATQADVFSAAVPYLNYSLQGLNTTIFTYGQTGTGKTHTMLGHDLWELASSAIQKTQSEANSANSSVDLVALQHNESVKGLLKPWSSVAAVALIFAHVMYRFDSTCNALPISRCWSK